MYKIIRSKEEGQMTTMLLEQDELVEIYIEQESLSNIEGNIYLGRVQKVLPGMQIAFIQIGEKNNSVIHLKDVLPKQDITQENVQEETFKIQDLLKPGMPILVQARREQEEKKGAKVTTHLSFCGRYLVFTPDTSIVTISKKIEEEKEKDRLRTIAKEILPPNCGVIFRTSSQKVEKEILQKEMQDFYQIWKSLQKEVSNVKDTKPRLLYKASSMLERLILDLTGKKIEKVIINCRELLNPVETLLTRLEQNIPVEIQEDFKEKYGLETTLAKVGRRKAYLNCGGSITIDQTEALTAIDVNSGKCVGKEDLEETLLLVNEEATVEIAKRLRLHDIGGIIVIDYINMKETSSKERIKNLLEEETKKDRTVVQVFGFTTLNLMEVTRKKIFRQV